MKVATYFRLRSEDDRWSNNKPPRIYSLGSSVALSEMLDFMDSSNDILAPFLKEHLAKMDGFEADVEFHTRICKEYGRHAFKSTISKP